jgi:hypothetical protein
MTNGEGYPVAEVYAGNIGDPKTVADQMKKLRERWMFPGGAGGGIETADPATDRPIDQLQ